MAIKFSPLAAGRIRLRPDLFCRKATGSESIRPRAMPPYFIGHPHTSLQFSQRQVATAVVQGPCSYRDVAELLLT